MRYCGGWRFRSRPVIVIVEVKRGLGAACFVAATQKKKGPRQADMCHRTFPLVPLSPLTSYQPASHHQCCSVIKSSTGVATILSLLLVLERGSTHVTDFPVCRVLYGRLSQFENQIDTTTTLSLFFPFYCSVRLDWVPPPSLLISCPTGAFFF